ncbi:hypothetical protein LIER_31538 [Lithospermum erythrorhizon]|uniref:Secreted protein n=1 Tax=Lithospermum erythrorhizon TaxID=34254 RepID=A0AAV3RUU5_LITER
MGSFILAGMTALRISGEKGTKPASSVFVPCHTSPVTFTERASTYRCRAATISVGDTSSGKGTSCRLCCPITGSLPIRTREYRSPPHPPRQMIPPWDFLPLSGEVVP